MRFFEKIGLVLFHPEGFGLDEPWSDPVPVDVINRGLPHSIPDFLALFLGPGIHPDHARAQRFAVRADGKHNPHQTRKADGRDVLGKIPLAETLFYGGDNGFPIVVPFLLCISRFRVEQRMFLRSGRDNPIVFCVQNACFDIGGPYIDSQSISSCHLLPSTGKMRSFNQQQP